MSDLADRAQALEEMQRSLALSRHHNRQAGPLPNSKGRVCLDCGQRIPSKRLKAHPGASRCIEHARAHEARQKHYRKD